MADEIMNRQKMTYFALCFLTLEVPETKIAEFANSVDHDEMTHNEPPHLDLHRFSSRLCFLNMIYM